MASTNVVEIPLLADPQETVELELDALPEDVSVVIDILVGEQAKLSYWLVLARHYWSIGQHAEFRQLLEAALQAETLSTDQEEHERNRIDVYALLSAYYVKCARDADKKARDADKRQREESNKEREKYLTKANKIFALSEKVDLYALPHRLVRGYFRLLSEAEFTGAMKEFSAVLSDKRAPLRLMVLATLGRANVEFNMGRYADALKSFRAVLHLCPNVPAEIRVGIGMCLERLSLPDQASEAFDRVLQMDPNNEQALIAKAVLSFNSKKPNAIRKGMEFIAKAYKQNKSNPMALNHLSNHCFFKRDYDKASVLAHQALQSSDTEGLRALSSYNCARVLHAKGSYKEAFKYYYQAVQLDPSFTLARYGLGQMALNEGNLAMASEQLVKVLDQAGDNYETQKTLGSLYRARADESDEYLEKAKTCLTKATKQRPGDAEAWIELAALLERTSPQEALSAYHTAEKLFPDPQPELTNNIGCLRLKLGDYANALKSLQATLDLCQSRAEQDPDSATYYNHVSVTTKYNKALALEGLGQTDSAIGVYKELLQEHPSYTDARLRMGCIARDSGDIDAAKQHFESVLEYDQTDSNAWALLAGLDVATKQWQPAQKKYERILTTSKHDAYSRVALGNMYLMTARIEIPAKYAASLQKAADIFSRVLIKDPKNIFAANGIGCILALKGQTAAARDVFIQVREATGGLAVGSGRSDRSLADVWLNLGHVYVEQGQHANAIKIYENCLRKFLFNCDSNVMMLIARAHFKLGQFQEARRWLIDALHVDPSNNVIRFNLALVQQRFASSEIARRDHSVADVQHAVRSLEEAKAMFSFLLTLAGKQKFDPRAASKEAQRCDDHLRQAEPRLVAAREAEAKRARLQAARDAEKAKLQQQLADAQELERIKREEEAKARQAKAEEYQEKLRETKALHFEKTPAKEKKTKGSTSSKKRKKEAGDFVVEEESGDDDKFGGDSDGDAPKPAKASKPKQKQKQKRKSKEKSDKAKEKPKKRRLQRSDSDSDSDAASDAEIFMQKAQEFKSKGGRRSAKVKSSEFVSDSDSDGEVAPAAAAAAPASLEADAGAGGASDQDDGNDAGGDGAAGDGGSTPMEDVEAADASE
eukprot:m.202965 g.202965  ORF g.202965 m.202965 type:complete len:1108 (+) comp18445_c0_seq7:124-3447(+)